ncbi:GNAT family N-acetyltransferase [Actinokineospora iranica]|uniref:Acetyltransferase (GNAT) domain-containing protein n=1 Tax=Actinokineospora iranica TaxID=1271860 RepID=A0A1G6KRU5_9PSEU|nr:GNAT family N-acetyltransferase [Actinokineospora iranica]SDC33673.1 Acetyltransferase (GNAT) domain-containing protein [Actinokineospora iranica]
MDAGQGETRSGQAARRLGEWVLRSARPADVEPIAELRATVLRPDLLRLGRFDEHRVRQRFRDSFTPRHTSVVVVNGDFGGCVAVRPAEDGRWLEHFYLVPELQGRGLGSAVLRTLLRRIDTDGVLARLNVLRGSNAQRLYERHGFTVCAQDPIDVYMVRQPGTGATGKGARSDRTGTVGCGGGSFGQGWWWKETS